MLLDILCAGLHIAEPLCPVLDQEPLDEVPGRGLHVLRVLQLPPKDLLVDTERIVVKERRIAWVAETLQLGRALTGSSLYFVIRNHLCTLFALCNAVHS